MKESRKPSSLPEPCRLAKQTPAIVDRPQQGDNCLVWCAHHLGDRVGGSTRSMLLFMAGGAQGDQVRVFIIALLAA